ncbi:CDP-glycerol glycerophosphotransferase family protein [Serinicoccus chungangensis]|uniref:CDP-glycerol glycerophosphotransferase family protein n=1 Tax=Serinicoccus chungangensis TaxID=767452 RepID=UPI001119A23E|nr:CDP-glycerol glycerophosphotransferase family protein [Serinicoccus chungangensis]
MTSAPPPEGPPSVSNGARVRATVRDARFHLTRHARRVLRRRLVAARRSDNAVLQRAYVLGRQTARRTLNTVTDRQVGWVATLWSARWLDGTTYELTGWAYERGYGHQQPPQIEVELRRRGSAPVRARVEPVTEMEINGLARRAEFDYANTAFVARFDLAPLLAGTDPRPWRVHLRVTGADGRSSSGTLKARHRAGSARVLGARTFPGGVQLVPRWVRRRGLSLERRVPGATAAHVEVQGREVRARVELRGVRAVRAELVSRDARRPLTLERVDGTPGTVLVSAPVPETWTTTWLESDLLVSDTDETSTQGARESSADGGLEEVTAEQSAPTAPAPEGDEHEGQRLVAQTYRLVVVDEQGVEHVAATPLDQSDPVQDPRSGLLAYSGDGGSLLLGETRSQLVVSEATLEPGPDPRLVFRGTWGGPGDQLSLSLVGRRQTLSAHLDLADDGTWSASTDLLQGQWGGPARLPRTGSYVLRAVDPTGGTVRVMTAPSLIARTPEKLPFDEARLRWETGRGRSLRLRVGLTRGPDELGSYHQRRMDAAYLHGPHEPQQSVYLESFYGRLATCNPFAIDAVIAREHPDWVRYWGVTDLSVPVPEGAIAVVEGTQAWFDARATSRYVVVNDWLRSRFVRQPFQTVLQTWHGSMFKRIGLDRPTAGASTRAALLVERDKWDVLLSQNHHSTRIFRSAYAWEGTFYEEGYPRNDALVDGSGEHVRERLGIRPDQKAVLYAPTWRDNTAGMVLFLDLERLTAELGEDYVVLLRGHSRTVGHGRSVELPGVIDVTTYPSITELFLAADAMITDYSSVMFDFSVTRRPMIFYVPDLDEYRDDVRGVYFDLAEEAPGPVVSTQDAVVDAIRTMDDTDRYAERYDDWVERFNHLDDGRSAERVVRRLFGEG